MKKWLKYLSFDFCALLLGALTVLAFAPYEVFPLAILAPAGLIALTLKASPKRAFWLGFLFGIGLFGAGVNWVFISIHQFGNVPNLFSGLLTVALIAYLALYPAICAYLTQRYFPAVNRAKMVYAFPAIWVATEWVRGWLMTGFPWLLIGYSQTNSPLKGLAPILGVYGVSLAVILTSGLLVNAVLNFSRRLYRSAYLNLFTMVCIWTISAAFTLIPWTEPVGDVQHLSLVQGNIPQALKWSPSHLKLSFDRYTQLTEPLWGKDKIIIWPEAAIPLPLPMAARFIDAMDYKAKATGSHLILGIPTPSADGRGYHNAVVTLGEGQYVYLKRLLVPFGEYVPLTRYFARIFDFMKVPMSDMQSGNYYQEPLLIGKIKVLTSICYEIAFPELIRSRDRDIGFLLTVTNDAWFGKSNAQAQHLQMAAMRAIELMRPVVFVSNDGITAIIDPEGRVEAAAPQYQIYVLNGTVQPREGLTPWMKNGMDPVLFTIICLLIAAVRTTRKQKTENNSTFVNATKN